MVKIPFLTFALALDALAVLRQNHIPASYWPQGGDTSAKSVPVTHNVAVDSGYEKMARSILQATS